MVATACPCAVSHAAPQLASQFWCPQPSSLPCPQNPISSRCSHRRRQITCCTSSGRSNSNNEPHQQLPDVIKLLGRYLWGQGLPPGALVGSVRSAWNTGWLVMMKQLAPSDARGGYQRPNSKFRNRPSMPSAHGRYHLYVSLTCPWAHRTAIVHALKGFQDAIPLSVTVPSSTGMWVFDPQKHHHMHAAQDDLLVPTTDRANRCSRLVDVYKLRKHGYDGRATVPMLWDSVEKEVVNNESSDIIDILNSDFNDLARNPELDLAPQHLRSEIDNWNDIIYPKVNNGVYRCGFAQGQEAYSGAVEDVFSALDLLDEHLTFSRYLCGSHLTLADVCLFTTLYRFDPVYYNLFKCSKRKIIEYPNLYGYLRDLYQVPGIASTCDMPTIMAGYYKVLFPLNPGAITPVTPLGSEAFSLILKHDRECLSSSAKTPAML